MNFSTKMTKLNKDSASKTALFNSICILCRFLFPQCSQECRFFNNLDKILMFHNNFHFCVSLFTYIFFSCVKVPE